ncbi:uncharacterized protein MYCFIDRAFT_152681, partial [Pseudocercospora fijiensis CIRAD86]
MSTEEHNDDGQESRSQESSGQNVEYTSKSEMPPSSNVITVTPRSAVEATAQAEVEGALVEAQAEAQAEAEAASNPDYFTLHPASAECTIETARLDQSQSQSQHSQDNPQAQPLSLPLPPSSLPRTRSNPSPAASLSGSDVESGPRAHSETAAKPPSSSLLPLSSPRPAAQTAISSLSIESTESSATVRPAPSPSRPALTTQLTFPSQALAELHKQQYPASYVPTYMRGPHVNTFSSAIASHYARPHRGTQTSHNSPAVTPSTAGLFSPHGPASAVPLETESDASGTYASPFLHFTHTHAPKETHTADVDIDPVSGRKVINNYEIVDELGRGTHGKVKLGRDLYHRDNYVAIKIVERFSKRRKLGRLGTTEDKVKKEVAILKKARHPNVVALLEVIDDPSRKKVYIVLDTEGLSALADEVLDSELDSDLEFVPVMTIEQIRVAFRDTLLGLQYLHYQGIIHRDIKPPNLLSTAQGRVKISDFGHGEDVSEAEAHDQDEAKELAKTVGTPAFYAPELCSTDPADEPLPVTKAIDVWALGITLFCMLFARTPFVDDQYVVMRQIADDEVYIPQQRLQPTEPDEPKSQSSSRASSQARNTFSTPASKRNPLDFAYENLGDELHDLLSRLLIKDPRDRITLEEVRHHPWVLADLPDQHAWLEETDPTRQAEKKIEISKDEINAAVVPLNLMERVKSVVKGVSTKLGLGTKRERSQSSASLPKDGSPGPSAHSSSSTISSDARRMSIRAEQIVSALQSSHDQHPLSKSVAASPDSDKASRRVARLNGHSDAGHRLSRVTSRPTPHRAMTLNSATESMRTVTPSDFTRAESPPKSPGLPGTPQALATLSGSALGGLLGGAARMVSRVRESSRQRSRQRRGPTSETSSVHSSDHHAEATLAVSDATAA